MLNRRILRIKAFKVIYAYAVRGNMSSKEALSYLNESLEAVRDLYVFMLGIVPPLSREAGRRIEAAKGKFSATKEEMEASDKFAANSLAALLEEDPDFIKQFSKRKFSWDGYDVFIREVLDSVQSKDYYRDYMAAPERSLQQDCALFRKIFEQELDTRESLQEILEDMNICWVDDLAYALTWDCRALDDISKGRGWRLPELYLSDETLRRHPGASLESDEDFVKKLTVKGLAAYERVFERVVSQVSQWDRDRLFAADMAIITLGVVERENFPSIPESVTLNEWIEISKDYSSPKSRKFVNGILDRLIKGKDLEEKPSDNPAPEAEKEEGKDS